MKTQYKLNSLKY